VNARIRDPATPHGAVPRIVQRRSPAAMHEAPDHVASEVPVALHYNGASFAVLMATPCDLADLAIGFSLSEGLVAAPAELDIEAIDETVDGIAIHLRIPEARAAALATRSRNLPGYGGCGICGSADIAAVLRAPPRLPGHAPIDEAALHRALASLQGAQPLNAATGATHAAAFADAAGELRLVREDVGRHNALDKLIGAMATTGVVADDGFAIVTSRASYELAMKAAQAGLPLLAAISAPTSLAIAVADSAGLCLVAFARDHSCAVYTHPQRLLRAGGVPA
jgi:FdhD protein